VVPAPNPSNWLLYGSASLSNGVLTLTNPTGTGWAYYKTPVNPQSLTVSFDLTVGNGNGSVDGAAIALLDASSYSPSAVGGTSGGLAFLGLSGIAVGFDDFNNGGCDPSGDFVEIFNGGACPGHTTNPAHIATYDLSSTWALYGHTTHVVVSFQGGSS